MVNQNKYILIKIKNTFQIRVFMYLRYLDMLNKNIFDQNKEYLPNMRIHVFEVLRTWSTKLNIFLIKIKNTFEISVFMYLRYLDMLNKKSISKIETTSQIRVFMYLRYLDMLNKNIFTKIETTSQICVFMYLRYSEHGQPK